ncbi:MAG: CAP domain-containing protein [Clostridiales bacterium]|nr:CAP domain-containing protein [Clostridiales bacterium]
MIKLKLISLLLSGCLATGIGAGNLPSNFKNIRSMDPVKIIERIYNPSKEEPKENVEEEDNQVDENVNKNNNGNASNEDVNNNDSNTNENNETSNEAPVEEENNTPETPAPSEETNTGNENNNSGDNTQNEASDKFIAEIEQAIFARVNKERAAAGLPALQYNDTMEHYARIKSQDMGDRGYFDHRNPEGQLITAQMQADGVSYRSWGENIAYISGRSENAALAEQFMDNWMNSSGHRANILSRNFTSIGVGVYKVGNTYYATQEFYR